MVDIPKKEMYLVVVLSVINLFSLFLLFQQPIAPAAPVVGKAISFGDLSLCVNRPPIVQSIPDYTLYVNMSFQYQVNASDPDNNGLSYFDNTTFFDVDVNTGFIDWPTPIGGNHSIRITVRDDSGCYNNEASVVFKLNVHPNTPPNLTQPIPDQTWAEDTSLLNAINLSEHFSDPDGHPLTYAVAGNVNITVIINQTTSMVSFTQPANWYGTEYVVFYAYDYEDNASSNTVTLTVYNTPDCGNSIIELGEQCDGFSLGGASCLTLGYDSGTLSCSGSCTYDDSQCQISPPPPPVTVTTPTLAPGAPAARRAYSLPCLDVTYTEREVPLELTLGVAVDPKLIPRGYELVVDPFNLDCAGESLAITISIPENFVDVQALKCKGGICSPTNVTTVRALRCGKTIVKELERVSEVLEPDALPINITEIESDITSITEALKSGDSSIRFKGELLERLQAKLSMPTKPIQEAANPSLQITGTPLVLTLGNAKPGLSTEVTMPYIPSDSFEPGSIAVYVKSNGDWVFVGGEVNEVNKTVSAVVENVTNYLDENEQMVIAAMGILCTYCLNTSFELVYEPVQESREAILLIHGLASSPKIYDDVVNDIVLTNQPYKVYALGYPSSKSVDENSDELIQHIQLHSNEFDTLHIVGHSLGGMIAQQALYKSYLDNERTPGKYSYLDKIDKVVLIGVPNEGTPIIKTYENLFRSLINEKSGPKLFNVNAKIIDDLARGKVTPRLPGVTYYVIAGTRAYEFNRLLIPDEFGKTDGIVPTKSAQNVGDEYINDSCSDYWEIPVSHTNLVNNEISRKLIEKIVAREILAAEDIVQLGTQQFFDLTVSDCDPEDTYIVIGKPIAVEAAEDITGCACGNGVCGVGEDELNCPADCLLFFTPGMILWWLIILLLLLLWFILWCRKRKKRCMEEFKKTGKKKLSCRLCSKYYRCEDKVKAWWDKRVLVGKRKKFIIGLIAWYVKRWKRLKKKLLKIRFVKFLICCTECCKQCWKSTMKKK